MLFMILLFVVLMFVGSWVDLVFVLKLLLNNLLCFVGNLDVVLLIVVFVSFFMFGKLQGFNCDQIQKFCGECLVLIVGIMLIVGVGGGFGGVLCDSGILQQIVEIVKYVYLLLLLFGWFVVVLMCFVMGLVMVVMMMVCGIVVLIVVVLGVLVSLELLVFVMGLGLLIFLYVNDGGFWLIKEYFGMMVGQMFKIWLLFEIIILVFGFSFMLLLSMVL